MKKLRIMMTIINIVLLIGTGVLFGMMLMLPQYNSYIIKSLIITGLSILTLGAGILFLSLRKGWYEE